MQSSPVIPGNPFEGREHDIRHPGPRATSLDQLFLVKTVQRLRGRVVVRVSLAPYRADRADLAAPLSVPDRRILHSAVGMMDKVLADPVTARPDRHLQRVEGEFRPEAIGNLPADDFP